MVQWACQTQGQGLSPLQDCLHFRCQLQVWKCSYLWPTGYKFRGSHENPQVWQFTGKTQTIHWKCSTYDYYLIIAQRHESEPVRARHAWVKSGWGPNESFQSLSPCGVLVGVSAFQLWCIANQGSFLKLNIQSFFWSSNMQAELMESLATWLNSIFNPFFWEIRLIQSGSKSQSFSHMVGLSGVSIFPLALSPLYALSTMSRCPSWISILSIYMYFIPAPILHCLNYFNFIAFLKIMCR